MAHSVGKVVVNKVVSMGKEDLATFQELKKMGIEFDVRKVPSDSPENIDDLIAKAESLL
jgi:PTS system mannose-specific IIB component